MNTYSNLMTVVFEGIDTDNNGKQTLVRRSTVMSDADTWTELLQEFMFALRGAGYFPNVDDAVATIQEVFPTGDDGCTHADEDGDCDCEPAF